MPTENRSSNTEMVSVPREHDLKIRRTPLDDLLSGAKTGEIRDCSDREFAAGDTVLLREVDDARAYTGRTTRRTITHVQKHYGLPDHLCVLSYGQPAPQPQAEPVAHARICGVEFDSKGNTVSMEIGVDNMPVPRKVELGEQLIFLDDHRREVERLRAALKFYADREHYHFESGNWDTVSGEPLNILWCGDEPDFIEDGSVARAALSASAEPESKS